MFKPKLYAENGLQARRDTVEVLEKHLKTLNLKNKCNVLDVGCGPGNVTHDFLLPLLPKSTENLIGIDVSPKMVDYAKRQYVAVDNLSFYTMDILSEVPNNFKNNFDHIFSFYCLHLINNHRKVLNNIYDMLKPGGNVLFTFQAKCFVFDIYESLSKSNAWMSYMCTYKKFVTPTQFCEDPISFYYRLLNEVGFKSVSCCSEDKIFPSSENVLKNILSAVNIIIPNYKEEAFILDVVKYFEETNHIRLDEDGKSLFLTPYTLFTVIVTKP